MSKRFKHVDALDPEELIAFMKTGVVPELPSDEEAQALRDAGVDPETRGRLDEVEAGRKAQHEEEQERELEMREAETKPIEQLVKEEQERNAAPPGALR
jgi:hypothetical protein